jgi:hypothetical protein
MKKDGEQTDSGEHAIRQIAFRVPEEWVSALQQLSVIVGFSQQRIGFDAFAVLLGTKDENIQKRHEIVVSAVKKGKVKLPFDMPLTSLTSSAAMN